MKVNLALPLCALFLAGSVVLSGCSSSTDADSSDSSTQSTSSAKSTSTDMPHKTLRENCEKNSPSPEICQCLIDTLSDDGALKDDAESLADLPRHAVKKAQQHCEAKDASQKDESPSAKDSQSLTSGSARPKATQTVTSPDSSAPQPPTDLSTPDLDEALRNLEDLDKRLAPDANGWNPLTLDMAKEICLKQTSQNTPYCDCMVTEMAKIPMTDIESGAISPIEMNDRISSLCGPDPSFR